MAIKKAQWKSGIISELKIFLAANCVYLSVSCDYEISFPYHILPFKRTCVFAIASIKTNATKQDSVNSIVLQQFKDGYDFALSFTQSSYWWRNTRSYKIFAQKDGIWTSLQIKEEKNNKGRIRTKISKRTLSADSAMVLIGQLTHHNFWTLDNDSLNRKGVPINDSMVRTIQVFDGANQRFEVITKEGFRIIQSYEPEEYLKKFPQMNVRKTFIDCRQIFVTAWANNRS